MQQRLRRLRVGGGRLGENDDVVADGGPPATDDFAAVLGNPCRRARAGENPTPFGQWARHGHITAHWAAAWSWAMAERSSLSSGTHGHAEDWAGHRVDDLAGGMSMGARLKRR